MLEKLRCRNSYHPWVVRKCCSPTVRERSTRRSTPMNEASHIIDRDDPSAPAPLLAAAKALRRLAPSYNKFYIVGVEDARALTEAGALASQRSRFDSAFYALCGVCHTLFALTRVHDADCLDAFGQRHLKGPIHTERCVECTASGEWPALPPVPPVSERTPPRASAAAGMGSVEAPAVVYAEVPGKRATRSAIPARKRVRWADGGASRQEVEDEGVAKTQVCWAKVVGFPWWPAVAATPVGCVSEVGAEAACAGSVFVRFYGTAESAWLTRAAVVPFAVGAPAPPTKQEEKRAKKFEAALREAKAAVAAETAGKKLKTVHREAIHPLAGASSRSPPASPPPPATTGSPPPSPSTPASWRRPRPPPPAATRRRRPSARACARGSPSASPAYRAPQRRQPPVPRPSPSPRRRTRAAASARRPVARAAAPATRHSLCTRRSARCGSGLSSGVGRRRRGSRRRGRASAQRGCGTPRTARRTRCRTESAAMPRRPPR